MNVHLLDLFDQLSRWITAVGVPGVIGWFVRQKILRTRAEKALDSASANVAQATVVDKIKSSSITALEAQQVAMSQAYTAEREAKDRTIAFQRERIAELEEYATSRDSIIAELRGQVSDLQKQLATTVDDFQSQLAEMAKRLEGL